MSKVVRSVEYESCLIQEFESGTFVVMDENGRIARPTIKKLRFIANCLSVSHFTKNGTKKTTRELGRSVISAIEDAEEKKGLQEITNITVIWPPGVHTVHGRQDGVEWSAKRDCKVNL